MVAVRNGTLLALGVTVSDGDGDELGQLEEEADADVVGVDVPRTRRARPCPWRRL